jgi:hypothetical protein
MLILAAPPVALGVSPLPLEVDTSAWFWVLVEEGTARVILLASSPEKATVLSVSGAYLCWTLHYQKRR